MLLTSRSPKVRKPAKTAAELFRRIQPPRIEFQRLLRTRLQRLVLSQPERQTRPEPSTANRSTDFPTTSDRSSSANILKARSFSRRSSLVAFWQQDYFGISLSKEQGWIVLEILPGLRWQIQATET
jgi:hypothetical protein